MSFKKYLKKKTPREERMFKVNSIRSLGAVTKKALSPDGKKRNEEQ